MARVLITFGSLPALTVALREGKTIVGSSPSDDIVLALPEVGPRHLTLLRSGNSVRLSPDENEGVLVNGRPATDTDLRSTDVVGFGPYLLRFLDLPEKDRRPEVAETDADSVERGPQDPIRKLLVLSGPDAGREAFFDGASTIIGRAPECELALHDPRVSWRHVALERTVAGTWVRDLGSRNGTWLEGQRVDAAFAARGARLRVGKTTILLTGVETDSPPAGLPSREEGLAELVGSSAPMRGAYERIRAAARSPLPLLLTGETGVGKELAARAVHVLSDRARKPFVPLNCAAIPREMIESELFGHVRGAFTGAVADHKGAFERARGGTLFLDEIAELPLELQPKLLRMLESHDVTPLGGESPVPVDARVVAATNQDLSRLTAAGRFRSDLYFRLAVLTVTLPPLREHLEDIPALVHHFLRTVPKETGLPEAQRIGITPDALQSLANHAWPGNVRELRSVLQQAVLEAPDQVITSEMVEALLEAAPVLPPAQAGRSLEDIERDAILNCLKDCNHVRRAAARRLGIAESTLYEKIRRYGLEPS